MVNEIKLNLLMITIDEVCLQKKPEIFFDKFLDIRTPVQSEWSFKCNFTTHFEKVQETQILTAFLD